MAEGAEQIHIRIVGKWKVENWPLVISSARFHNRSPRGCLRAGHGRDELRGRTELGRPGAARRRFGPLGSAGLLHRSITES